VKLPLTLEEAALVGVAAAVGVVALVFEFVVAVELLDEEAVALEVAVAFFFVVALLVAAAFAFGVGEVAVVTFEVVAAVVAPAEFPGNEVAAEAPAKVEIAFDPNCGGVTDRTAPRPPTVPPAISNARFMPHLFFFSLLTKNRALTPSSSLSCPHLGINEESDEPIFTCIP